MEDRKEELKKELEEIEREEREKKDNAKLEKKQVLEIIENSFKEIGWMDDNGHRKNFKAFSNGAWADVQKIRELYERLIEKVEGVE